MRISNPSRLILVVEDEWLLRHDIAKAFRRAGWEVLEASTGEGALRLLQAAGHRINAVITDIQLAGYLSGWDVADAVRRARPDIPIVYATGITVDRRRQVSDSFFFSKPYRVADVLETCARL